ncbi:hypothetical protein TCA2_5992 [Paenibacillus sp. TCA20]|uniref:hypothetical protein n=1 Tax=Paenibacillus sp. TCA20 TaxID=1499968 RepID=UPI0004D82A6A|nr:hypothetical protein [Paenibacillus sp. TCA20]GAK43494.1 hypothetical protein TCA2_5992 [Paenibacillus sp. TCA20]
MKYNPTLLNAFNLNKLDPRELTYNEKILVEEYLGEILEEQYDGDIQDIIDYQDNRIGFKPDSETFNLPLSNDLPLEYNFWNINSLFAYGEADIELVAVLEDPENTTNQVLVSMY